MARFLIRNTLLLAGLALIGAACGPQRAATVPAATEEVAAEPSGQPVQTMTDTPFPSPGGTATETPLPPLVLPTQQPTPPPFENWDGAPTYPGDSTPGMFFRLTYDPRTWALTVDQFGQPALGHRQILYCVISQAAGRGLPLNLTVEHDFRTLGAVDYEISTAYEDGQVQFVNYAGGDSNIYTAFQVNFDEHAEDCLQDAEVVLASLVSIPESEATPAP